MLNLHQVAVTYPNGVQALQPVSAEIPRGRLVVLLGPSGAGKSTLLRCLNGLVRPTRGTVEADGLGPIFESAAVLRRHRRDTGMIFQQHHLIGRLTALRNVLTGRLAAHSGLRTMLPLPRHDRLLALQALDRVGLADRALERVDRLSGGQQQRVGIARAMAQEPRIVLADEPVASLDLATAERVLGDLFRICREDGITAIVSLHQVALARRFADRVLGLADGRLAFDGAPDALTDDILQEIYAGPAAAGSGRAERLAAAAE